MHHMWFYPLLEWGIQSILRPCRLLAVPLPSNSLKSCPAMSLNITDVLLFLNSDGIFTLVIDVIKYRVATECRLARLETMMIF